MLISEVAAYLQTQGIGTLNTDLFYAYLPGDIDDGIAVIDTGGMLPDEDLPTKEPTFQVLIRSSSYAAGKAKMDLVRSALHQVKNSILGTGTIYFYFILAMAEGGHIGRNESGLDEFSINFRARTR